MSAQSGKFAFKVRGRIFGWGAPTDTNLAISAPTEAAESRLYSRMVAICRHIQRRHLADLMHGAHLTEPQLVCKSGGGKAITFSEDSTSFAWISTGKGPCTYRMPNVVRSREVWRVEPGIGRRPVG